MQSIKTSPGPSENAAGHAKGHAEGHAKAHDTTTVRRAEPPVWHRLSDEMQLVLAREAMIRAAATLADQAEMIGLEMEAGTLHDRGGPEASRLFAAIIRATNTDIMGPVGHA